MSTCKEPARTNKTVLRTSAIHLGFNSQPDLLDLCPLEVCAGSLTSLCGDNSVGKTTLLRLFAGHFDRRTCDFQMEIAGNMVASISPRAVRKAGVSSVHQNDPLFPELSIWENVMLGCPYRAGASALATTRSNLERQLIAWQDVPQYDVNRPLEVLSGGIQSLIRLCRAIMWQHRVLLLDEPTAALAEKLRDAFFSLVSENVNRGVAIIMASHYQEDHNRLKRIADEGGRPYQLWYLQNGHIEV